jgi:tetratricopeptide (TPR) repeat protein
MKKIFNAIVLLIFAFSLPGFGQKKNENSKIDMMLIRSEFKAVIDTCKQILEKDTLNSEVYYKLGVAYQNLLFEDKSFECFQKAISISPDNKNYNFTVAKSYFTRGVSNRAKPILLKLYTIDSTNWAYAYYLTSIYMQEGKYDESIKIYQRFRNQDLQNYTFLDKIGFAYLKKGEYKKAIEMYNNSLSLNPNNLNAIKNLAYLYTGVKVETSLKLLDKGVSIDSTDMDLFARRAALNFTIFNYDKALNDYLKIINSGDSSVMNLKRAGIGFTATNHSKEAVKYLLKAYEIDTADFETLSYLAQNYSILKEFKTSAYYYNRKIKLLNSAIPQLGLSYILLGEVLKSDNRFNESVTAYIKSQEYRSDNNVIMIIANLYDEKLKNIPKAIYYYELYLRREKNTKNEYSNEYNESIRQRIESLKTTNQKPEKAYSIQKSN